MDNASHAIDNAFVVHRLSSNIYECYDMSQGPYCNRKCRHPNYGINCQNDCMCDEQHCNHITGCLIKSNNFAGILHRCLKSEYPTPAPIKNRGVFDTFLEEIPQEPYHQNAVRVTIRINPIQPFVLSVYQGILDRVASLHADILTMDKTVSQNVCVMRRSVIISRGVNRKHVRRDILDLVVIRHVSSHHTVQAADLIVRVTGNIVIQSLAVQLQITLDGSNIDRSKFLIARKLVKDPYKGNNG
uniref:Uncharacterized protein n=1 Tax=Magallana gigas TaxID=29159 RepID=K1Q8F9_MAGGI